MSNRTCNSITQSIVFSENAIHNWLPAIDWDNYTKILILVDTNTKKYCLPLIAPLLEKYSSIYIVSILDGEKEKNIATCQQIWESMTQHTFDRKSLLINLGGGVIGDMGGFCAASFKRGIDFINIPTTLLAQVDASVGGKLGIDFNGFKNHIGFFKNPKKVIIDTVFLKSLPYEETRSGFAEIIKHCLIRDKKAFELLQKEPFPSLNFIYWIKHSVKIKSIIIEKDPYEKNLRKLLNFGHTIGHAVETFYLNQKKPILHGEAVALGIICETFLSTKIRGLPQKEASEIYNYILSIYPKILIDKKSLEAIAQFTYHDKKNSNDIIETVLLDDIGQAKEGYKISIDDVINALTFYYSCI